MATRSEEIVRAVERFQAEVPSLVTLKLVVGLELTAGGLTRPGETESFRVELPGPKVTEGKDPDARIRISVPRTMFKLLGEEGELVDWREAYHSGHLKVGGDARVKRLLGKAISQPKGPVAR